MSGFLPGSVTMRAESMTPVGTPGDTGAPAASASDIRGRPRQLPAGAALAPAALNSVRRVNIAILP